MLTSYKPHPQALDAMQAYVSAYQSNAPNEHDLLTVADCLCKAAGMDWSTTFIFCMREFEAAGITFKPPEAWVWCIQAIPQITAFCGPGGIGVQYYTSGSGGLLIHSVCLSLYPQVPTIPGLEQDPGTSVADLQAVPLLSNQPPLPLPLSGDW